MRPKVLLVANCVTYHLLLLPLATSQESGKDKLEVHVLSHSKRSEKLFHVAFRIERRNGDCNNTTSACCSSLQTPNR